MINQAIILAAGNSTRTYPLTVNNPKPLLKVLNQSLLEHNLKNLEDFVKEVIIIVGFQKEKIMEEVGTKFGKLKITYVAQKEMLGTGHAVSLAETKIKGDFILLMGDNLYSKKDIENCVKAGICVLGAKVDDPQKYGVLNAAKGILKDIEEKPEKPKSNLINTALYVLPKSFFALLKKCKKTERGELEVPDALNLLAKARKVNVLIVEDYWLPIGYPWEIVTSTEFLLKRMESRFMKEKVTIKNEGTIEEGAQIRGAVVIGKNTLIKSGAYIEGPAIIGNDCIIGPNCYIKKSVLGNGVKIGNGVEIDNSVLFDNINVRHLSYIGESILSSGVNIGAGTMTGNLRHDGVSVSSMVKNKLIDTKRRKLGAILAENVKTGIGTLIYPGRKIWPGQHTLPGEIVKLDKMG